MADAVKIKTGGAVPINVSGARSWLGGGTKYEVGAHRALLLGYNTSESAGKGTKMFNYVFQFIKGSPEDDIDKQYAYSCAYESDGGRGLYRGIAEAINPTCIKKVKTADGAAEVVDFDKLAGYVVTFDMFEEEYTDPKTQQVKSSVKADMSTLRDVEAPGSKGGENAGLSAADLDGDMANLE